MRYLLAALALCFSFSVHADEIISVQWDVIGIQDSQINLASGVKAVERIEADVRWGPSPSGLINGMIVLEGGTGVAAVGSCVQFSDNLGCEFQVRGLVYRMTLDSGNGNGELVIVDEDGFAAEEGAVVFK